MNWSNPVSSDLQGAKDIQEFLLVCFDALDTYGKTPQQLSNAIKLFIVTLSDYPAIFIRKAFEEWVKTKSKMPTPAEIIEILDRDNHQLLDYIFYVRSGGNLADFAQSYLVSKLGKNWREYV